MKLSLAVALLLTAGCASVSSSSSPADTPSAAAGVPATSATAPAQGSHTEADVAFMQGMILHHAQAVAMTALVEDRTENADIRLLARRIDISQVEEMELMRRWLRERGEEVPEEQGAHAHHHHHHHGHGADHALMPGMLSPQELERLSAARGAEFDRLFLEFMIRHHEGALVMVADLFAAGGGQDAEIFQFASHVDGDQRIEIARMYRMLGAVGTGS